MVHYMRLFFRIIIKVNILSNTRLNDKTQHRRRSTILLEFLGSMNLAISLLVVISIAAVIGTVLQQNQPYNDYVFKFGPFWFEVFKSLGLFDIYGSVWFLFLLGFLMVSTSVCVYRQTPGMLKDMNHYRLNVQEKSLRAFHHQQQWELKGEIDYSRLQAALKAYGYRFQSSLSDDHNVIAGMKGSISRFGYLLTHVGIVVICVGGLVDGNVPLKISEWRGQIEIEKRDVAVDEIPKKSQLGEENVSFRGSVSLPEGSRANFVFLPVRDGYLLQNLPFSVELKDFRIEHYESGMPKNFESDLVIHDPELEKPLEKTIQVNHPWIYKGYNIYQASFADGGSEVVLDAYSLDRPDYEPLRINGIAGKNIPLSTTRGDVTIEISDFKMFNIFPPPEGDTSGKKFHNYGPSVVFKIRSAAGDAREYVNYFAPVTINGRPFIMSGVREQVSQEYSYIHIPVDPGESSIKRFLKLLAKTHDKQRIREIVNAQVDVELGVTDKDKKLYKDVTTSMLGLIQLFLDKGFDGLVEQTEKNIPEPKRQDALQSYVQVIQSIFANLYLDVMEADGVDVTKGLSDIDALYFDDALNAISLISPYGSPLFLKMEDFKHIEASGLQITRAPGQNIVYLGCVMLMLGIFLMIYIQHRRVWLLVSEENGQRRILFAGSGHRNRSEFDQEFAKMTTTLQRMTNI